MNIDMDQARIITDLEGRARKARLSVAEMCRRAQIAPSTFNRWRTGETSPTLDVLSRVERVVSDAETAP